ncbi:phage tail protein [Vibrio furnissii]|uniref:phage tail-collar fiber domain-containing protein n=1 Tax=Vibrio furnissii TaxID=29494 RepID=UPI001EEA3347|nr:phage tail protein [Vibrio furnissii]
MANTTDKSILTAAGKALLAQLNAEEKPLIIDKMIFANVPNRPEFPQPDDVVPTDDIVHQEQVEQRGRLSADSVIYSTTLTSDVGPFEFNWTGAYCSEYGVLVTIDHHSLTPKSADESGVAGNTLVRSVILEYKEIAEITNITVDASSWQYNATPRMKKMDDDVAQAIIDQNGKDWFIEDGFLVTPSGSAYNIKAGAGYVSGNRVSMEFDRSVQVPNKPSFIYIDAHREGTPTGEQVTLFDFVITAEEKDDYIDSSTGKDIPHLVCKIAEVLADGSVSDLRPEGKAARIEWVQGLFDVYQPPITDVTLVTPGSQTNEESHIYDDLSYIYENVVNDSGPTKRYNINIMPGWHDACRITLRDYVDMTGIIDKSTGMRPVISHNFDLAIDKDYKQRDILRSAPKPYEETVDIPIRCKLNNLIVMGKNCLYPMHLDFNKSEYLNIVTNNCRFHHEGMDDGSAFGYGAGIGQYGGQYIELSDTDCWGAARENDQMSGYVWHNRADQDKPCTFVNRRTKAERGSFGARWVDYNSGQEDQIILDDAIFKGKDASILLLQTEDNSYKSKLKVMGKADIELLSTEPFTPTTYPCHPMMDILGFCKTYTSSGEISEKDIVVYEGVSGINVTVPNTNINYKTYAGVALGPANSGKPVCVQYAKLALVKSDDNYAAQTLIGNSKVNKGNVEEVVDYANSIGVVLVQTNENKPIILLHRSF